MTRTPRPLAQFVPDEAAVEALDQAEPSEPVARAAVAVEHAEVRRGPRPAVPKGWPITEYGSDQLVSMVNWIESDTRLRTQEELVRELMHELGFRRRGQVIDQRLRSAIAKARGGEGIDQSDA